jgi:hypothetical protein
MCFINLYHVHNILCKGHHSISSYYILEHLEKSDF